MSTLTPITEPSESILHNIEWPMLQLLNVYRLLVIFALAVTFYLSNVPVIFGALNSTLFVVIHVLYFFVAVTFCYTILKKNPKLHTQFYLHAYLDITLLCLLMYTSGGVQSGLGLLLVVLVTIISHCTKPQIALLFSAIASVMLLSQELYLAQTHGEASADFTQAALTGLMLFVAGFLVSVVLPIRQKQMFKRQYAQLQALTSAHTKVTHDLKIAADLQASLLPEPQSFENVVVMGFCNPALYVAGDVFDFFSLSDDTVVFYMADVVGHGAASAMISYAVHNQLNPRKDGMCLKYFDETDSYEECIAKTLWELNGMFSDGRDSYNYFTLLYAMLNLKTGDLSICQAGHTHPLVFRQETGEFEEIGDGGMPIGLFGGESFEVVSTKLNSGDRVYVYSDGLSECFSPSGEQFGLERSKDLISLIQESDQARASALVLDRLTQWHQSDVYDDDISILRVQFE